MKRRNADCGKIRRPIKKNKIAEQIGSNTLLYIKFLLLWASVITADFLLEFRFEFLWPFWLLLRSIYDSYKYKGLAFSVLFVCIAVTSDLVCLFFIPVQWLFFAASTYVWVQYVWHTDKGICLPTIILWVLFVYLEAAIRWKDSRNIPHLNLCRPFAAHCIGYPVVTLGFGFKSYVGYRIRQRKQREVAKDNDFYMQLLQEALPKEESTALLEPVTDAVTGAESVTQKELVPVATANNSLNHSSSSTASNRSDTGQHHHHHNHHNHNHHNHSHHQQQQSKGAQSYKSSSNSTVSSAHVNGHVSSGSSPSSASSTMNGGLNHATHPPQGSSKHRKSLDKEGAGSSNPSGSAVIAGSKMNGSGGGGNYSYHQATTFQQTSGHNSTGTVGNSNSSSSSSSSSSNSSSSGSGSSSNAGSATNSTKENTTSTLNRGSDHCNGGSAAKEKDSKEGLGQAVFARKDYEKEASSSSSSSSSSTRNGSGPTNGSTATNRSKSPTETTVGSKPAAGKQNGHVSHHQSQEPVQQPTSDTTVASGTGEAKVGGRSGRKNRLKKAAEQANLSAIAKLCATLALASSVTTLTTTTTATTTGSGGGDRGASLTSTSSSTSGAISSATAKDNHSQNSEQEAAKGNALAGAGDGSLDGKSSGGVPSVLGALKSSSSGPASGAAPAPPVTTTVLVQKACESCPRLEGELKKTRAELASQRHTENEMRQKYDSITGNLKVCLQAKQKDYDELQTRYQEHSSQRQQERQNLQTVERRLGEERRHRQSLEAQLNNERKYRKQAEEKAARAECGEACKMNRKQVDMEMEKLQHELLNMESEKLMAEKQARNFEQEMRKMEMQVRTREVQQNTEVLMSALAAMQDKNATLEKNLSAETRVKLDLFSALGATRRELEILSGTLRTKEKEILDLNAKIVQLVAVMPTMPNDALCLTGHGGGSGSDGTSMMRLADAPQLLPQSMSGGGHMNGVGSGNGMQSSGPSPSSSMSHMVPNGPPFCSQLGSLGVLTSSMTTMPSSSVLSGPNSGSANSCGIPPSGPVSVSGCQIVQMQNVNGGGSNGNCPSNLDPNASIYTPKNNGMVGGTEA